MASTSHSPVNAAKNGALKSFGVVKTSRLLFLFYFSQAQITSTPISQAISHFQSAIAGRRAADISLEWPPAGKKIEYILHPNTHSAGTGASAALVRVKGHPAHIRWIYPTRRHW
jgi:hypothetical protein